MAADDQVRSAPTGALAPEWEARPLRRLLRLWGIYARMDLLFIARGVKLAVAYYVADLLIGASSAATTYLLAERFGGIGPWTRPAILFMLGYGLLVRGMMECLFSFNISYISRRIGRGQLDHMLVAPLPIWMSLLTEGFMPVTGSGVLILGLALTYLGLRDLALAATPGWVALLAVNLAGSAAVMLGFNYWWATLAFWAPRAAEEINSSTLRMMHQLKQFPLDGLGALVVGGLVTLLPVGLVAWYPARALVGLDPWPWALAVTPLAGLLSVALAAWLFSRGMKQYGRTGSTRYLSYGFRR
jgi:ABC-2 type transport system permease protein